MKKSQKILLEGKNLTVGYGKFHVLKNVDFTVYENEILILMGPNGAGKSTVLKALFGIIPHSTGHITFEGKTIKPTPRKMVQKGISFVSQSERIFPNLSIKENLLLGAITIKDKKEIEERLKEILKFFPILKNKLTQRAFSLSGGERQILSVGRALMTNPKLLILDEPSLGLAPKIVKEVFEKIKGINAHFGTSILIVEHNLKSLLTVAHRGYILAEGKILLEGPIKKLATSEILEKVFFGELA